MSLTEERISEESSVATRLLHQDDPNNNHSAGTPLVAGSGRVTEEQDKAARFRTSAIILVICIASFVLQTELTKFIQTSMGYQKPYFILYISHSFWAIILPAQFLYTTYISSAPHSYSTLRERITYFHGLVLQSTHELNKPKVDDHERINRNDQLDRNSRPYHSGLHRRTSGMERVARGEHTGFNSRDRRTLHKFLFWLTFLMTTLFMIPSYLWYTCVALTSMANLTAIYNTACFFAYLFSVILLGEEIVFNKVLAVVLSLVGVAVITLMVDNTPAGGESGNVQDESTTFNGASLVGDALALCGAALYGLEEVVYKKYASPPSGSVLFANVFTGLMGVVTMTLLWIPIPILHLIGHEVFSVPTLEEFMAILMIAFLGLVYNGCFMIVVALTSPVFAAVGVMATIPLVAVVDWVLFGQAVGLGNIIGGICICTGFSFLVREIKH